MHAMVYRYNEATILGWATRFSQLPLVRRESGSSLLTTYWSDSTYSSRLIQWTGLAPCLQIVRAIMYIQPDRN